MEVLQVKPTDIKMLQEVLQSNNISNLEKISYIQRNNNEIKSILKLNVSSLEFKSLIKARAIVKFRPLKNSYTKKCDRLLLSKALGISPSQVKDYIKTTIELIDKIDKIELSPDKIDMLKIYIFRHGTKDELIAFLDYELKQTKNLEKYLYKTLVYHTGGIADYFIRPIHRMDNKTLVKIYNIINKHINKSFEEGNMSDYSSKKLAKWALIQIYRIQNNSKLINAIKTYKVLK